MRTALKMEQIRQTDSTMMILLDTSSYNPDLPISNAYLNITPPGFTSLIQHSFQTQGATIVTTRSLGLSSAEADLPVGIYKVHQTIKPNNQLYADHHFAFVVPLRTQIVELICQAMESNEPLDEYFLLQAELDTVEWLAKADQCKKAESLLKAVQNKLKTLCAEHV